MPWLNGSINVGGPNPPSPTVLAATVAEVDRRMGLTPRHDEPALRVTSRIPPANVALMTENAARLAYELRRRGKTAAEAKADLDAFAGPFIRGFYAYATENGEDSIHTARDISDAVDRLVGIVAEMAEWTPA